MGAERHTEGFTCAQATGRGGPFAGSAGGAKVARRIHEGHEDLAPLELVLGYDFDRRDFDVKGPRRR